MAKKSVLTEVVDATRSVAGAALGAAARAGTEVVVGSAAVLCRRAGKGWGRQRPGTSEQPLIRSQSPYCPASKSAQPLVERPRR